MASEIIKNCRRTANGRRIFTSEEKAKIVLECEKSKVSAFRLGRKEPSLTENGSVTARDQQKLETLFNTPHPLKKARMYDHFIRTTEGVTRADTARHFGVSRARVTQALSLLNLQPQIIQFVDNNRNDSDLRRKFTETNLRKIASLKWSEQSEAFGTLINDWLAIRKKLPSRPNSSCEVEG